MKYLKLFALVILLSCGLIPHDKGLANFWGSWKVIKGQPADYHFAFTQEEADNLYLNKVFTFRPEFVISDFSTCSSASYAFEEFNLLEEYSKEEIDFVKSLSNGKEIQRGLVITTCHDFPLENVVKLSDEVISFGQDGFIFFLTKIDSLSQKYTGKGVKGQTLRLSGTESTLRIAYQFYGKPGQLFIEDQDGKQLFSTTIGVADSIELASVALHKSTKLVFKVRPNDPSTKWQLDVEIY